MTRKILISPGYGAGWTTWTNLSREAKLFMLEYKPIIDFLEAGGDAYELQVGRQYDNDGAPTDGHPLLMKFVQDFRERFPEEDVPYLGGADQLIVETVGGPVRLKEYDGFESIDRIRDEDYI